MASSRVGTSTSAAIPDFPESLCRLKQPLDDRNQEGQRFAGSGLGRGEHVFAGERLRNRRGLHRGRDGKVKGRQSLLGIRGDW